MMPRALRIEYSGAIYVNRGDRRESIEALAKMNYCSNKC